MSSLSGVSNNSSNPLNTNNSTSNTPSRPTQGNLAGLSVSSAATPSDRPSSITGRAAVAGTDALARSTSAPSTARAAAAAPSDSTFDGRYVGANGQTSANIADVQPVRPNNGTLATGKQVFYVNGIQTDLAAQQTSLQLIANQTGANVVGIHNATEGFVKDVAQSALDKANLGRNPAVDTLADAIYNGVKQGQPVNIIAHSQGGIITSRAVGNALNRLREDGLSASQARQQLSRYVNIETFGGAAKTYPSGPNYRHFVNTADPVPDLLGKGTSLFDRNTTRFFDNRAGLDPRRVFDNHSLDNVYLSHIDQSLFK